ncbi:MAG: rhomboid family intramembrane serine protease [Planctomycetes bacterium]|nr:rhomboid family intramembrane serine protease [Planctomycetota bacterium]
MIPIPIRTDYRMSRIPWINYALLAANIALYAMGYHGASVAGDARIGDLMLDAQEPRLHQFVTCVFLHASILHLLGNMLFLWVFGGAINDKFGHIGYLAFYLAGGVLASLGYVLFTGTGRLLGASGAISAVTGAYLVLLPRSRVTVLWFFIWIFPMEISSLLFLAFQFIFNLFESLAQNEGEVAYAAHCVGYVFGIAMAAGLLAVKILPRDPMDLLNLFKHHRRRTHYRRVVAGGYDPFSYQRAAYMQHSGQADVISSSVAPADGPQAAELELRKAVSEACQTGDLASAAQKYLELVAVNPQAVLPCRQHLDVANRLTAEKLPAQAADAYELFLKHYPTNESAGEVSMLLGVIYARYLGKYDMAEQYLAQAVEKLRDHRRMRMAEEMLREVRAGRSDG